MMLVERWRRVCTSVQWLATGLIFFTAAWWWRPTWSRAWYQDGIFDDRLYFVGFGFFPLVLIALIAWGVAGFPGWERILQPSRLIWLLGLVFLVAWMRISYGADVRNADVAYSAADQWLWVLFLAISILCNPPPLQLLIFALVASLLFLGTLGTAQVALQSDIGLRELDTAGLQLFEFPLDPAISGTSIVQSGNTRFLRPYAITAHPNMLAGALALSLLASLSLWNSSRSVAVWLTVLGGWVLLLTFSRAGIGGFVVGAIFTFVLWPAKRQLLPAIALGAGVASMFLLIFGSLLGARLGVQSSDEPTVEQMSTSSRAVYIEQAQQLISENPIAGVGIGNFAWESANLLRDDVRDLRGDHVHNIYLLALAETGIVGTIFWGVSLLTGFVIFLRHRPIDPLALCLMAGLLAWLALGWFDHYPWTQFGYQILFWGSMAAVLGTLD